GSREGCASRCMKYNDELEKCEARMMSMSNTEEDCEQELEDLLYCLDHCHSQ
uniref:transferrin receptor binding cystine-dense peptide n=1 Tax=Monosiga brevicollis TaxID=81824 RepID=UPI00143F05E8|nr:Chain C, transferrin receptor binding cystine-dense peptide [Monosiga brevicollis]6OKD_D Chain D, transferrin receptor binding cystine-dense peptide [Monosiga brevicollis]6OKE_A Chain A, Transferrin-Receptor Binding Peptide [Monosiga brevicollis]6OKE_B Chain B, Transferrin-Receptor Binding Peptide [Monosiga brevicollis]6OKE_C Chain C, Transferrin-Receptor Binding Peptide [Monosiga brevicollis]6OKE_D Chain D, Transferrin-Receptor Binding Peptide [Monosiga brevicollis]